MTKVNFSKNKYVKAHIDYKEKKVETSKIEGEITSNYQFIFDKPKPFSKQFFNINEFSETYKKSDEYMEKFRNIFFV